MTGIISEELAEAAADIRATSVEVGLERFALRLQKAWQSKLPKLDLTDDVITRAAREMTLNPFCCVIRNNSNGTGVCGGRLKFVDGEARIIDPCGRPCDFVCRTAPEFGTNVNLVRHVVNVLNLIFSPM